LNRYRKNAVRAAAGIVGKVRNAPNTAIGLGYGLAGHALGMALGTKPKISLDGGAVQFRNNPFGGVSAITLGDTTTWNEDPYDPKSQRWNRGGHPILDNGHTQQQHEHQHVLQGEQLGMAYLPSNLIGGLFALTFSKRHRWHDPENWNELEPQMDPPRPWAQSPK